MDWNRIFSKRVGKLISKRVNELTSKQVERKLVNFPTRLLVYSLTCLLIYSSCRISYSFQGGKLNYELVKTITIQDFPNRAAMVYPPLAPAFDQALRNRFIEQTRLVAVDYNGDIEIEGEITGYNVQGTAVKDDAYASRTKLTITVHLRYTNHKEEGSNVDQSFSAFREYDATKSLDEVQDGLMREIIDELIDLIYNATVANW